MGIFLKLFCLVCLMQGITTKFLLKTSVIFKRYFACKFLIYLDKFKSA